MLDFEAMALIGTLRRFTRASASDGDTTFREILCPAMSEENIDTLRRMYESFNRGDFDDAVSIAHPDVEFYPAGGSPSYRGAASVRRWMEPDALEDQLFEPLEFVVQGDKVLVRQRVTARGAASGIEVEADSWGVWTFDEEGRVIRVEGYRAHEEAQARKAAGLSR